MKNFYILAFVLLSTILKAQCPAAGLTLSNQSQIDNIAIQYPTCTTINGDVIITGNNITNLNGLAGITTITGALEVRNNPALTSLSGLQNLTSVGTDLIIRSNNTLSGIASLSSVVNVGGELTVRSNNALTTLNGLQGITTVGAGLIIRANNLLTNASGLENVTSVGEILEFVQNPVLTVISMPNLTTVTGGDEGALVIEDNNILANLTGLGTASTTFNGDLTISINPLLTICSVPSICNYLDNPPTGAVITINSNATGCNTQAQVETGCSALSNGNFDGSINLLVTHNPVSTTISVRNTSGSYGTIILYDTVGKLVLSRKLDEGLNKISAEALMPGIYIARLEAAGRIVNTKIIKQ